MSEINPDPFDRTVIIPGVPELPAESTLILPGHQTIPAIPGIEPRPPAPKPRRGMAFALWAAAVLLLTGGLTWWFLGSGVPKTPTATEAVVDTVPPSLQRYLDAAKNGDPKAMRMLGASYTYGLGVRINKTEGATWYRKAAEAGDTTAAQELKALGAEQR